MQRRILTLIFAFLLLFMQRAEHAHALGHVGEWFHTPHDRALHTPDFESECTFCVLFAGGSTATIGNATLVPSPFVGFAIAIFSVASRSVAAPSYYASRAPPSLL